MPALTAAEKAIVDRSFGDWTNFMASYGLKPWDADDIDEAHAIIRAMANNAEADNE